MSSAGTGPVLSVIIPVRNRPTAVCEAINSVLSDAGDDVELIVVDDGSTDDTVDAIKRIDDDRLRVVSIPSSGVSVARNEGVAAARSGFVAFLDSDDLVLAGWAAAMTGAAHSGVDLFTCGTIERHERVGDRPGSPRSLGCSCGGLTGRFEPGTFGVRRAILERVGPYVPGLRHGENSVFWMELGRLHLSAPLRVRSSPISLTISHRRDRPYDAELYYASAIVALDRVGDMLRRDRRVLADYLSIAGVAASRLGRRREALGLLGRAIAARPLKPIGYARWAKALVGR